MTTLNSLCSVCNLLTHPLVFQFSLSYFSVFILL